MKRDRDFLPRVFVWLSCKEEQFLLLFREMRKKAKQTKFATREILMGLDMGDKY